MRQRVAVFVSGNGSNLQALIDASSEQRLSSAALSLVIASRDGIFAIERAKKAGIPVKVIPRKCHNLESFERTCVQLLEEMRIDLIVLAGFMTIFSENFTKKYPKRILNVHPSLLPAFCGPGYYGLRVHEAALARGVKFTGATVHFVDEICDGGEIILQKVVEIDPADTPETLQKRVMEEAEWNILPKALEQVSRSRCHMNPDFTGTWKFFVDCLLYRGDFVIKIDHNLQISLESPQEPLPKISFKEINQDGHTLRGTVSASNMRLSFLITFHEDHTAEGLVSTPMFGKISLKNGKKIS